MVLRLYFHQTSTWKSHYSVPLQHETAVHGFVIVRCSCPCMRSPAMPLHHSRIRARNPARAPKPQLNNHSKTKHETFASTKDDKRRIKHASFVARIEKSSHKPKKRRRPSKKLVTNLESLLDALPTLENSQKAAPNPAEGVMIRQKTLKSRPGAMKKKAKMERLEMERFNRNLARLADCPITVTEPVDGEAKSLAPHPTAGSWQALRKFITSTLDNTTTQ